MNKFALEIDIHDITNYREFLKKILCNGHSDLPRGALAKLARKAEISRSFLSEVLNGKKKLTITSFDKISKALKLPVEYNELFAHLIAQESEEFSKIYFNTTIEKAITKQNSLKKRILQKNKLEELTIKHKFSNMLSYDIFCVYAGLGTIEKGIEFSELIKKTNIDPVRIQHSLEKMIELGWVKKINQTYFATERTLDFQHAGQDIGFLQAFSESLNNISKNINQISAQKENLLMFSAISIKENRIIEFNQRIRSCLLEIMDEFQDDSAFSVKKINLSIY